MPEKIGLGEPRPSPSLDPEDGKESRLARDQDVLLFRPSRLQARIIVYATEKQLRIWIRGVLVVDSEKKPYFLHNSADMEKLTAGEVIDLMAATTLAQVWFVTFGRRDSNGPKKGA